MARFETKPLMSWAWRHKKTPRTTPIDIEVAKDIDENDAMVRAQNWSYDDPAQIQANTDIKEHYGPENVVNDTIDSSNVAQDAFTSIPAAGNP